MRPGSHDWSVVDDAHTCVGNTGSADHQAVGEREQGPLRDAHARGEIEDKGRAVQFGLVAVLLEERHTLLAI